MIGLYQLQSVPMRKVENPVRRIKKFGMDGRKKSQSIGKNFGKPVESGVIFLNPVK